MNIKENSENPSNTNLTTTNTAVIKNDIDTIRSQIKEVVL